MRLSALLTTSLAIGGLCFGTGCDSKPKGDGTSAKSTASTAKPAASGSVAAASAGTTSTKKLDPLLAKVADTKAGKDLINLGKDAKMIGEGLSKKGPGLTEAQFEALLLGLKDCEVKDNGIDRKCEAYKAYREGRKNRGTLVKDWGGMLSGMGRKHIKHEAPAVRIQAANLMGSIFGSSKESQGAIIAAAQTEKHPRVLKAMLRSISSSIAKNDDVRKLMLANANHADEKVRMEVVGSLTSSWARDTEGTLEKAMEIVEKDPSAEVRQYACRRLGERADERALPLLKKLTAKADDEKLYSACVRGVIAMWSSPVPHKAPSEAAFKHTLEIFKKTPRSKAHPPWTSISAVEWAAKKRFQDAAPWYKNDQLIAVLMDVVKDRQANWLARTGGVDALKRLGATPAQFADLAKSYADAAGKPSTDKHVLDKIQKVSGKAPAKK